jgi:hypothetical protein
MPNRTRAAVRHEVNLAKRELVGPKYNPINSQRPTRAVAARKRENSQGGAYPIPTYNIGIKTKAE